MIYITFIRDSWMFVRRHIVILMVLTLVAALGRAAQNGGIAGLGDGAHATLEAVIGLARFGIVLVVIGEGNVGRGFHRLVRLQFRIREFAYDRYGKWSFWHKAGVIAVNVVVFVLLAGVIDGAITPLSHILADSAVTSLGAKPIEFFLKNMTTIPFTTVVLYSAINFALAGIQKPA